MVFEVQSSAYTKGEVQRSWIKVMNDHLQTDIDLVKVKWRKRPKAKEMVLET
jgi:hypothetical protein